MSFDPSRIKAFKGTTSIYPGKDNAMKMDYLCNDNSILEATVKNQEGELLKFLKLRIGSKLKDSEMKELQRLIEEYSRM